MRKTKASEGAALAQGGAAGSCEDTEVWQLLTGHWPSASRRAALHSRDIPLRMYLCSAMWAEGRLPNTALGKSHPTHEPVMAPQRIRDKLWQPDWLLWAPPDFSRIVSGYTHSHSQGSFLGLNISSYFLPLGFCSSICLECPFPMYSPFLQSSAQFPPPLSAPGVPPGIQLWGVSTEFM